MATTLISQLPAAAATATHELPAELGGVTSKVTVGSIATASDPPSDGNVYLRGQGAWQTGGTLAGNLSVNGTLAANTGFTVGGVNCATPVPTASTFTIGQFVGINTAAGGAYNLPAGGSWVYCFMGINASNVVTNPFQVGLAAGGTLLWGGTAGVRATGFCWRIA